MALFQVLRYGLDYDDFSVYLQVIANIEEHEDMSYQLRKLFHKIRYKLNTNS